MKNMIARLSCYFQRWYRCLWEGTPEAIGDQNSRIIGRVSMDMLTVDLTGVSNAKLGDKVELWGSKVPANTVAKHCDTIAYELFTRITRRVSRQLV